jgi:hypothetical protein
MARSVKTHPAHSRGLRIKKNSSGWGDVFSLDSFYRTYQDFGRKAASHLDQSLCSLLLEVLHDPSIALRCVDGDSQVTPVGRGPAASIGNGIPLPQDSGAPLKVNAQDCSVLRH